MAEGNPKVLHHYEFEVGEDYVEFDVLDSTQVGDRIQVGPYYIDVADRKVLNELKDGKWKGTIGDERRSLEETGVQAKSETEPLDDPRQEKIAQALASLNPEDDAHWTKDGKPDLNVIREKVGSYVPRGELPEDYTRERAR